MKQPNTANMQALSEYTKVEVHTGIDNASPCRLIQMLLDGALARIVTAKGCLKQKQAGKKGENISSAISIIGGLRDSLDHEAGGAIAGNLENLYEYMTRRLVQANLHNDESALDEVHTLLMEIRVAWNSVAASADAKPLSKPEPTQTAASQAPIG
ncbi:MAG: flagellar export chaperone FliS [Gammaproteobacteria bacterium]